VLEQHRPALRDGVVAEPPLLHRERGGRVGEVLRVAGLVKEHLPVGRAADRLDHEHDALRHLDRRAERARVLGRPVLEVEVHVRLRVEVDPEARERRLQRRHEPVGGEMRLPARALEQAVDVPAARVCEPDPDALAEELVRLLLPELLGRVEEAAALGAELFQPPAEALHVEVPVRAAADCARCVVGDLHALEVDRVQVLVGQLRERRVEPAAPVPVVLVRHRRAQHPVVDLLAVDRRLQGRLELRDPLGVRLREVAHVALAGEAPELPDAPVPVDRRAERLGLLERRQVGELLVDRLQLEPLLLTGVVEVELLVLPGDEGFGALAERVEIRRRHGSVGYARCARSGFARNAGRRWSTSRRGCRRRSRRRTGPRRRSSTCRTRRPR
jgi:hypothetical protein